MATQREAAQQKRDYQTATMTNPSTSSTTAVDYTTATLANQEYNNNNNNNGDDNDNENENGKRVKVSASQQKKEIQRKKNDVETQRRTVFVNNLAFSVTEEALQTLFAPYGVVSNVHIVRNSHGKSRGFAYVEFAEENAAALAIELDKRELQGRKMEVKLSIPEHERKGEVKGKQPKEKQANLSSTIYVTGLPNGVSEYEFSVFFSKVCILWLPPILLNSIKFY